MKKYAKHMKICMVVNSICILLIFLVIMLSINIKITNSRINDEIEYISMKIEEQNNHLKIYRSELAIITSIDSLTALYKAYYQVHDINDNIKVTQIKTIDNLVGYFNLATRYSQVEAGH